VGTAVEEGTWLRVAVVVPECREAVERRSVVVAVDDAVVAVGVLLGWCELKEEKNM
jgi:hypothetical protein